MNSLLSNLKFPVKEAPKPYDIESNPTKIGEKQKVDTKSVMSNVQSALLNLIQKTNQGPNLNAPNNNTKLENNGSNNTIINANNINIINTTINNDICISNNVYINNFPQKNESQKLQIFNSSTIQLNNSQPIEKSASADINLEKKKSEINQCTTKEDIDSKEDINWKSSIFNHEEPKDQEEHYYNNEGNYYRKKKIPYKRELINKELNSKRKFSFSSSESSSLINNKNVHLKRKKRKSDSKSLSSQSRGSRDKKPLRKQKKYRRSYSKSSRSASKSIDNMIFNNLPKDENKEKEGEFYKKFLQRFNNKVQFEDYDRNHSKPKNYGKKDINLIVPRKNNNHRSSYKKGYNHYEGKYKPNYK